MRSLFRKIREANRPFCTALVAAAGSSSRMGGVDKLMEFLDGVPVLIRTLTALQRAESIDEIVIAVREDALVEISALCKTYGITKCKKVVRGGESRCHSVLLAALETSPDIRLLAVQDGAPPAGNAGTDRPGGGRRRQVRRCGPGGAGEGHHQDRGRGRRRDRHPRPQYPPGSADASGV